MIRLPVADGIPGLDLRCWRLVAATNKDDPMGSAPYQLGKMRRGSCTHPGVDVRLRWEVVS